METVTPWYEIKNVNSLDSPALVVFPERVKSNIRLAIEMAGGPRNLRPHIKTHKSPNVIELMLAAGITKFKCATIAEAELLGTCAAPDVLLAYQPTGPKLERLAAIARRYPATTFSCLVDNRASADEQSHCFTSHHLQIGVYIDLNVGMNRTGILPGDSAIDLYRYCASLNGLAIKGLHAYDGHIRNTDFTARSSECDAAFFPVGEMAKSLLEQGMPPPVIIAGGSHSFPIHSKRQDVECSPGTFIYWDKGNSEYCPEQAFDFAALLVTRVVSLPAPGMVCTDLGHKSVAAENPLGNRVSFLNAPDLVAVSQSEEHLVLTTNVTHLYKAGDILYGLPVHICPTVALYESVYTIEDGMVNGEWKTLARDRKISI
jgi:D-serine deaminase-like pyridoxal phosphate-dependent protein